MPIYKYYTAQGCLAQGFTVHTINTFLMTINASYNLTLEWLDNCLSKVETKTKTPKIMSYGGVKKESAVVKHLKILCGRWCGIESTQLKRGANVFTLWAENGSSLGLSLA